MIDVIKNEIEDCENKIIQCQNKLEFLSYAEKIEYWDIFKIMFVDKPFRITDSCRNKLLEIYLQFDVKLKSLYEYDNCIMLYFDNLRIKLPFDKLDKVIITTNSWYNYPDKKNYTVDYEDMFLAYEEYKKHKNLKNFIKYMSERFKGSGYITLIFVYIKYIFNIDNIRRDLSPEYKKQLLQQEKLFNEDLERFCNYREKIDIDLKKLTPTILKLKDLYADVIISKVI